MNDRTERKPLRISTVLLVAACVALVYAIAAERVVHAGVGGEAGRAPTALDIAKLPPASPNAKVRASRTDTQDLREGKLTDEDLVEGAHGEGDGGFVPQVNSR